MIVVVTEAHVRGWRSLPRFLWHSVGSMRQALADPACLGARIRLRGPLVWCTVTGWPDEASLQSYVRSGAHRVAMRATRQVTTATRFARLAWSEPLAALRWRQARAALDGQATIPGPAPSRGQPANR